MTHPHPAQEKWIGRRVRSAIDNYDWKKGLWRVMAIETKDDQIRKRLRKRGIEVWTDWEFNHWRAK